MRLRNVATLLAVVVALLATWFPRPVTAAWDPSSEAARWWARERLGYPLVSAPVIVEPDAPAPDKIRIPDLPKPGVGQGRIPVRRVGEAVWFEDGRLASRVTVLPGNPKNGPVVRIPWSFVLSRSTGGAGELKLYIDRADCTGKPYQVPLGKVAVISEGLLIRDPVTKQPIQYQSDAWYLRELSKLGYIDAERVDLTNVPQAIRRPGRGYDRQVTLRTALLDAGWPALAVDSLGPLADVPVPGTMYITLILEARPGDKKWKIVSWWYVFEVDAKFLSGRPDEMPSPPRCQCPPGDPNCQTRKPDCTKFPNMPECIGGNDKPRQDIPPEMQGRIICRGREINPYDRREIYLCVDPRLLK